MNILFDECVPWPIHKFLADHNCTTAQKCDSGGITNGELLKAAETKFDIFLTSDQNLRYQQNLTGRKIAIIELSTNKLRPLLRASAAIQAAIADIRPGEFRLLDIP